MIQEITNFVKYLEDKSPEVFSEDLSLKEGLYVFLEKEGDELIIKDENILKVDKKNEKTNLYNQFLERYSNSKMITNKSMNACEKIFIDIGSPFGISISGKGVKIGKVKKMQAAEAYFKAVQKYLGTENTQHCIWFEDLKKFVQNQIFEYFDSTEEFQKPKDAYMFYFFLKEPKIEDYQEFYNKYLATKVFLFDLKKGETNGISNDLNVGNVEKKPFMRHKTASFEINYKVNGEDATSLYKFFRLQKENKILPNPMPVFVDERELSDLAVKFYNKDKEKKKGHKEIIEHLLNERKSDLQNYYLIYFQNNLGGSRIADIDFVPVFRYKTDDMPEIKALFKIGNELRNYKIENIFEFETHLNDKLFIQYPKNSIFGYGILRANYFSDKIEPYKSYTISDTTVNLLYKYRKSIYDYIYKSKQQAITNTMFQDIMINGVLDDIIHDEYKDKKHTREFQIKEKLNIWFSLYNYFNNDKNSENMVNKTELLFERVNQIAKNEKEHMRNDEEFAFSSGQLIRKILNESESAERKHSLLEPFLQKTDAKLFKLAIARAFETYKHAFIFYKGDKRYDFDRIMSETMGFEPDEKNIKNLLPLILAGYFSGTVFKKDETQKTE